MPPPAAHLGNAALWDLPKTAFLCSRQCPAAALLKIYDWAQQARAGGLCVMSGFHTPIEKDVWQILAKGAQPVIFVRHYKLPGKIPAAQKAMADARRLLIVTPPPSPKNRKATNKPPTCATSSSFPKQTKPSSATPPPTAASPPPCNKIPPQKFCIRKKRQKNNAAKNGLPAK